ncbi:ABC transporter permease [Roseicyclus sp. F158]|uniref:ABC transporter permease n=1 Tax=Tropicimonas omnivorans TaxID=3075590 RepID=A0ABU3DE71_9RHOB|nr:ABC transporter permease [Roseicyclus sp. F158]MDT0682015.1 ABC transporter permease [Roseicyclus sp. F158]
MAAAPDAVHDRQAFRDREAGKKKRARRARWAQVGIMALSVVAGIAIWQLLSMLTNGDLVFAGPIRTFDRLLSVAVDGTLWSDFVITATEFCIAAVMAIVAGISIGVIVGYFRTVGVLMEPWLAAGYSTPLIALTPLFILWFGIGIWSKVAVCFIVMVFPILINTALGVSSADRNLIDVMRSLRASTLQIISKIIIRGSVPYIATGIRLAVGRGFTAVVAGELLGSNAGMGYRILVASQTFDVSLILAYVFVLALLGAAMMMAVDALSRAYEARRT